MVLQHVKERFNYLYKKIALRKRAVLYILTNSFIFKPLFPLITHYQTLLTYGRSGKRYSIVLHPLKMLKAGKTSR